jgi:hypothetical protein
MYRENSLLQTQATSDLCTMQFLVDECRDLEKKLEDVRAHVAKYHTPVEARIAEQTATLAALQTTHEQTATANDAAIAELKAHKTLLTKEIKALRSDVSRVRAERDAVVCLHLPFLLLLFLLAASTSSNFRILITLDKIDASDRIENTGSFRSSTTANVAPHRVRPYVWAAHAFYTPLPAFEEMENLQVAHLTSLRLTVAGLQAGRNPIAPKGSFSLPSIPTDASSSGSVPGSATISPASSAPSSAPASPRGRAGSSSSGSNSNSSTVTSVPPPSSSTADLNALLYSSELNLEQHMPIGGRRASVTRMPPASPQASPPAQAYAQV